MAALLVVYRAETSEGGAKRLKGAERLLEHARYLADLYNWAGAAPDFEAAERQFRTAGDKRNALYAHCGAIRATSEQRNLPQTSAQLSAELATKPLLKADTELRLFCLVVKGDLDQEIDTQAALEDWQEVHGLATKLGNRKWQNRSLASLASPLSTTVTWRLQARM